MSYFEPNQAPIEVINKISSEKRTIHIRFESLEDVLDFQKKTGISFLIKKSTRVKYRTVNLEYDQNDIGE